MRTGENRELVGSHSMVSFSLIPMAAKQLSRFVALVESPLLVSITPLEPTSVMVFGVVELDHKG